MYWDDEFKSANYVREVEAKKEAKRLANRRKEPTPTKPWYVTAGIIITEYKPREITPRTIFPSMIYKFRDGS